MSLIPDRLCGDDEIDLLVAEPSGADGLVQVLQRELGYGGNIGIQRSFVTSVVTDRA